ncbi:MAG: 50S ribosomal protein L32 [Phycisphaerae bacterium]|nr:50S ribosomal protein L32 [Phycisphaerae bacterium]
MLPTQKLSRGRTRCRRAHQAKTPVQYADCPKCNQPRLPHAACTNCGYVRRGLSLKTEEEK